MEWITAIRNSIRYIEEHLQDKISAQDVSDRVYMSQVHFQKGFQVVTGYSVAEYIRNRRLYLAALDLKNQDIKVIDVAYEYGYETPESFTKAFTRFHGISPTEVKQGGTIRLFLPLTIKMDILGGDKMDVKIRNQFGFKEWLPGNPDYELSGNATVEWYDCMTGEKTDPDYHSAIWLPVKKK